MPVYRRTAFLLLLLLIAPLTAAAAPPRSQTPKPPGRSELARWGGRLERRIDRSFLIGSGPLYADASTRGAPQHPAFMWGCGVQLAALAAAARLDSRKAGRMNRCVRGLDAYWRSDRPLGGYDVLPLPKPPDCYYDDNAWMTLDLIEAYSIAHRPADLLRAEKTLRFVLSGEDSALRGGIWWRERDRKSKNTCSNAPAAVGALELYKLTHKARDLAAGERLEGWTRANLRDATGLYFDHVNADGTVDKTEWSYNTALMIRAECALWRITNHHSFLALAEQSGGAAVGRWIDPVTGGVKDGGAFAHLLLEGFEALYRADGDANWRQVTLRALLWLHTSGRRRSGWYTAQWDTPVSGHSPADEKLLDQASAARAFLEAAAPGTWLVAAPVPPIGRGA
ncbi:MAG: hypothetical protein KGJ62_09285 [Armatimonadetes bacterium]|nr:hypothetical protein [Armatimonadota bacterium]MDE2207437.1 hypothetical protein [Armatimonadota bacterium]